MLVYHIVKNMQWQMLSSRGDDFGDGAMILGDFGDGAKNHHLIFVSL